MFHSLLTKKYEKIFSFQKFTVENNSFYSLLTKNMRKYLVFQKSMYEMIHLCHC